MAEHQEGALDLLDRLGQRGQGRLPRRIAEEGVQGLLDGPQIGADFTSHGFEQEPFLRTARHGVEVRQFQQAQLFAAGDRGEPADDGVGRAREILVEGLEVFQGRFGEQQRRGHFQGQDVVVPGWIAAQLVGLFEDGGGEAAVVGLTGRRAFLGDPGGALVERRQGGSGAGAEAVPVVLGRCEQFAQAADVGQQPLGVGGRRRRHHAVEPVGRAHDGERFAAGGGAGGLVERFAQGGFARVRLTFDQLLDLRTEAHREALGLVGVGQAVGGEGVEHPERDPPVGSRRRRAARHLDHGHRDFHLGNALGIVLDPFQQAALEPQPRRLEPGGEGLGAERRRLLFALRRPLRDIGEEQLGRAGRRQAARDGHGAIGGEQLQRLVRVARHQVVEVAAQRGKSVLRRGHRGTGIGCRALGQRFHQFLDRVGERRDAVEADDRQRAVRLVHTGARLLQVVAGGVGGMGGEVLARALEREVDLPLDPGQRTDVEIRAHLQLKAMPLFMCVGLTP